MDLLGVVACGSSRRCCGLFWFVVNAHENQTALKEPTMATPDMFSLWISWAIGVPASVFIHRAIFG